MSPSSTLLGVKSKFGAEFRRVCIRPSDFDTFEKFYAFLEDLHNLSQIPFIVQYVTPDDNCFLPINNDANLSIALNTTKDPMRIVLQRKGESYGELYGYSASKPSRLEKSATSALLSLRNSEKHKLSRSTIRMQDDFQLVCSILDAQQLPREMRRVRLLRTPNKQLGLYIRDGVSTRLTESGYETVPAFFIARLDKDGIAYSTGLLAENDEIIEVNGVEVFNKTMDQVTDMMIANSSNLIITIRPSKQPGVVPSRLPPPTFNNNNHHSDNNNAYKFEARTRPVVPPRAQPPVSSEHPDTDEDDDVDAGLITL